MKIPSPNPDLPRIPGYRLEAEIGRGRRSTVYLAWQLQTMRRVALKVARNGSDRTFAGAVIFQQEFDAQATLAGPDVIRVYDTGRAGRQEYLVMEYAAGGSMAVHRGALGHSMVLSVVAQAARALRRVHHHGWVHRDVKPANLLLRDDGGVALADFGCARRAGDAETVAEGTVTGTPLYAAPEQSGGAPAQPTADVYSLGVCLYQMVAGEAPFPGQSLAELLAQHLVAPVPRLAPQHAAWQPLVDAMLAKNPNDRPADGQAVLSQLQRMENSFIRNSS
jgi:serine/threonine protein kinase